MAGFKTHITTSTTLGVGYGAAGYFFTDLPLTTCMLAGGLCSVAGMLPDLDSDSGVPVRETMTFVAAVVPMLMVDRLQHMGLSNESIVLAAGLIYLIIRFGVAEIFKRYTVHRGMWHSLPAAATAGLLAFLACSCNEIEPRLFKAAAVVLGFVSHLMLDELWSIQRRGTRLHFKRSFGTAMKFWSKSRWANISTYAKLGALSVIAYCDPMVMHHYGFDREVPHIARQWLDDALQQSDTQLR